jgi:hypothetical protein
MFLGLLTKGGHEPSKEAGYCRLALSSFSFGVSPPREKNEAFTFINTSEIKFPKALQEWDRITECVVYDDVDSAEPVFRLVLTDDGSSIIAGQSVLFVPGSLQFGVWLQTFRPTEVH